MKNARELMLGYIEGTAEQSASLFAEKGTLELPYLASIGLPLLKQTGGLLPQAFHPRLIG